MFILFWTENHPDKDRHVIGVFTAKALLDVALTKADSDPGYKPGYVTWTEVEPDKYHGKYGHQL